MSCLNNTNDIRYKKNFLTEVVARVDFVSPIGDIANRLPKKLSRKILEYFPIDEPKTGIMQQVEVGIEGVQTQKKEFTEWNFFGRNREKRLLVGPDFFFITYSKYKTFEGLRDEFLDIMEVYFDCFEDAQPSRFGLRYINQISLKEENPLEWSDYINSQLLGLFSYNVGNAEPIRIFHNIEFLQEDSFYLRFQFGVHNPDFPAPVRKKIFILDYDAYFKGPIEPQDLSTFIDQYHKAIQNQFESNITEKLRKIMNE
ncbi:MAG: TIGR04255 family protein [Desulfobacterales bacterium]|nr:TIGR04255 family protein [Desulfobacterales bacterium]